MTQSYLLSMLQSITVTEGQGYEVQFADPDDVRSLKRLQSKGLVSLRKSGKTFAGYTEYYAKLVVAHSVQ